MTSGADATHGADGSVAVDGAGTGRSLGRPFRTVWLSVLVSSTGDGMFVTAFPLLAAMLTRDPRLIAGVTIALRLPWLLLALFTGTIADRLDKRRLLIAADVGRMMIVAVLGVAVLADAATIWMLYVCAFLLTTGDTLHVNTAQALLPDIVEQPQLLQANARFASAQFAAAQFAGPPLGVAAYQASASVPFFADAVSFAGSAALASRLPKNSRVRSDVVIGTRASLRGDMLEAVCFVWSSPLYRVICGTLAFSNFFYFGALSLLVLYTEEHLGSGTGVYSLLFVGSAAGTVLTRWFVSGMVRRLGAARSLALPLWLWAVPLLGMVLSESPVVAVAMMTLLGVGTGIWIAVNSTVRQAITPPHLLGRANAIYRTVSWGVVPFGAAFGGFMAHQFGLLAPFVVAGVAAVPLALAGPWLFRSATAHLR
ncbi:MAG: MFS transporter [Ilumatobacteraceae bacterium]